MNQVCRSRWPPCLRRRSAAACLLRSWVRIPPRAWMFVCCECCVLSDELITRPEESYRLWCVVCDLETSWTRRPWPTGGCRAKNKRPSWTLKSSAFFSHSKFLMTNNTLRLFPYNRMKDWPWKMWHRYWSLTYKGWLIMHTVKYLGKETMYLNKRKWEVKYNILATNWHTYFST